MFFFHNEVLNKDFSALSPGDAVEYKIGKSDRGPCAVRITVVS
ncbi:MAG: cold shock domain-containing protein [Alphaproteobacteria bacterium]|nr:cold shock domain-containing protein [Alphaproteobacteria bacterium]